MLPSLGCEAGENLHAARYTVIAIENMPDCNITHA